MKKYLCILLALALVCGMALAEAEIPELEITAVEVTEVGTELTNDAPAETKATPEATDEVPEEAEETSEPTEAPVETKAPAAVRMGFEDGFSLELPEGWLYHAVTEEMAEQGVIYCLSDAAGTGWLYIQSWTTDCADMDELKELIDRTAQLQTSGIYDFNGTDFVVYDLVEGDVSCCAALMNGKALNLVFTPQSDADFMAVSAQILNTFEIL